MNSSETFPVPVSRMAEVCLMTQSERWQMRYEQVMAFLATNHRRPSKYYAEGAIVVALAS